MKRWMLLPLTAVVLAGCAQASHGTQDAPVNRHLTDNSQTQVINFPDQFPNVTMKCDHHGHRLFATTRNDQSALQIVTDPTCPKDWP